MIERTKPGRRPFLADPEPGKGSVFGVHRPRADVPAATLIIDPNESRCNACGGGADPSQKSHDSLLGWPPVSHEQGCGVVWTHVTSNYAGEDQTERVQQMRPDLIWQEFSWTNEGS